MPGVEAVQQLSNRVSRVAHKIANTATTSASVACHELGTTVT
jgi:hypothetical protein